MILLTGDIHGADGFQKLSKIKKTRPAEDDYLIVLGDFSVIWHNLREDGYDKNQEALEWLGQNLNCKVLFVDGNHENFDRLNSYPVVDWHGGKTHKINEQVRHLMRGQVFDINGHTFFTMGGARSVDKEYRIEGLSWWREEEPSVAEYEEAVVNLIKVDYKVDYVLSHAGPTHIIRPLGYMRSEPIGGFFDHLVKDSGLEFERWFFGHYHIDKTVDKYTILYNKFSTLGGEMVDG